MSHSTLGIFALFLLATLITAHALGHIFARWRQPRVIGEILAGIILGPSLLGALWGGMLTDGGKLPQPIELFYWGGLFLLMFLSGAETKGLFRREEQKEVTWLTLAGTGLPFAAAVLVASVIDLTALAGPADSRASLILVIGIAVAVTSIPVISRIFYDLKILHTRFAKLVLGVAVIEDTVLWAILAVATALAKSMALPGGEIAKEVALTMLYFGVGLTLAPRLLRRLHQSRLNLIANASPTAYLFIILFAYISVAAVMGVNLVFAAFLAGLATPKQREVPAGSQDYTHDYTEALRSISTFSFAFFIPVYFALVGFKLDLGKSFSLSMLLVFLVVACAVKLISVLVGARLAGFRGLDAVNLAIATNARGGPGIVLASVAFEAQIISAAFYTTLILTAILTSQAAGFWLEYVLRQGKPLLSGERPLDVMPVEPAPQEHIAA